MNRKPKAAVTPAEWLELIRTMLPAPVSEHPLGVVGGSPGEVIVDVRENELAIASFRVEWADVASPVVRPTNWKTFRLDSPPSKIARAIQQARAERLRTYGWCVQCHEVKPPEWMNGDECHACMEKRGCVF